MIEIKQVELTHHDLRFPALMAGEGEPEIGRAHV